MTTGDTVKVTEQHIAVVDEDARVLIVDHGDETFSTLAKANPEYFIRVSGGREVDTFREFIQETRAAGATGEQTYWSLPLRELADAGVLTDEELDYLQDVGLVTVEQIVTLV